MDDREQVDAAQPHPGDGAQATRADAGQFAVLAWLRRCVVQPWQAALAWLERVDPGTHRRVKGLRLVTAYGLAAALGALHDVTRDVHQGALLATLAGSFAFWASVSEASTTRAESTRDLALLCVATGVGAASYVVLLPLLSGVGRVGPEITLISGAFCVGYLKRFGLLGGGIGSQIYLGQLYAYGMNLVPADLQTIGVAVLIAALGSIVPRLLSGPAERPALLAALSPVPAVPPGFARRWPPEFVMGLQAAVGAAVVIALNQLVALEESVWAITACTYVVAGSASGTAQRARRRIIGTLVGVPLGLVCLPLAEHAPLVVWSLAALAMIIYAMALPDRYDIACAAFAFILIVTLAANGIHSVSYLFARAWETLIGGVLGLAAALLIFPLRANREQK
ncbi:FUSC family protein [Paraburkholderia rhizosphaerae]|uniref:Fusaric acid resistance family protein n=1 Tax=Paraburkholderia rhizosphaerae TaxID=480658 RepID=A0A4R8LPS2_9BURK|nr:FUSC family protein [Paraburkholderia rhizosphaerae]TDY46564.1 fusaric acid resistance family protein [Paraburkholderia rhizosphaerae]